MQVNIMNNECDPDVIFYQNNVSNVEANYFLMTEVKSSLASFDPNAFSVLHLNIRSTKKNFKNFKEFLKNLSVSFSAICLLKHGVNHKMNHRTRITFYQAIIFLYQYRQYRRGGGVCLFFKNRFAAKLDKICQ